MKTQRRHDLKDNDLVHALERGRNYLDRNGRRLGMAVVVVTAVIAVTALTVRSQTSAREDRWRRLSELAFDTPEVGRDSLATLRSLIEEASDETFVRRGLVLEGQKSLELALKVAVPPDNEFNDSAREAFSQLRDRFADSPLAVGLALLGLATVEENAFVLDADFAHKEAARRHLTKVTDDARMDLLPFKRMAMDRLAGIDQTFTRAVFDDPIPEEAPVDADAADPPGLDVP